MLFTPYDLVCKKKPGPDKPGENLPEKEVDEQAREGEPAKGEYVLCGQCKQIITYPEERILKMGAFQHTFANPHGIVFEIGCFRFANGCGYTGPATSEFTWFSGYSWRIAVCNQCLTHLGWLFLSAGPDRFHGLILDQLLWTG